MENGTTAAMQPGRLVVRSGIRHFPRPRPPEKEKRYQRLLALRTSDPERFQVEVERMKERHRSRKSLEPPVEYSLAEIIQTRRASGLQSFGSAPMRYAPLFLTDLREATCATKAQAEEYDRLVNLDPANSGLRVLNRKTGLVDEEFTARMIERYRQDPGESVTRFEDNMYKKLINLESFTSISMVVNRKTDEESTARMMKHAREVPGKSSVTAVAASGIADEVQEGISVLKLKHYEFGESSGTVVTTSGNKDKMLCDCA